jgi:hypothetical protein
MLAFSFLPTLTTLRFHSDNFRSSRSTFASSPGLTSPSRRYITWLTRGSSSLILPQLQTVGCRVTACFESIARLFFFSDTHKLLSPIQRHPPIRYVHFNHQVRAIKQIPGFIPSLCGSPRWLVRNQDRQKSRSLRPGRFQLCERAHYRIDRAGLNPTNTPNTEKSLLCWCQTTIYIQIFSNLAKKKSR